MPLQKNQLLTLRIERLSSDGSGVAHSADGEAVLYPTLPPAMKRGSRSSKTAAATRLAFWTNCSPPRPTAWR